MPTIHRERKIGTVVGISDGNCVTVTFGRFGNYSYHPEELEVAE